MITTASEEGLALHSSETESGVECMRMWCLRPSAWLPLPPSRQVGFLVAHARVTYLLRHRLGLVGAFWALAYGPLDIRSFLSFGGRSFGRRVGGEQLWCRKIITWAEPSILHQHHNIEPLTTHDERS